MKTTGGRRGGTHLRGPVAVHRLRGLGWRRSERRGCSINVLMVNNPQMVDLQGLPRPQALKPHQPPGGAP
jgi:hypothetical protein